ncbi:MAG: DUF3306 domain-containing protein, partial [Casimicrobiaceae bacterium]
PAAPGETTTSAAASAPAAQGPAQPAGAPLPPIESLTIDSEYAPFFKPHVPEATRRAALKQLFRDPRFNIMDGLDVYIGDYTQPDPIPQEMMQQLAHVRHIFNPPRTEVNAQGHVVDAAEAVDPARPEALADATAAVVPARAAPAATPARAPEAAAGTGTPGNAGETGGGADS